jgi:hypothetical protein
VRICSLLKKWIEQHFSDFTPNVVFLMKARTSAAFPYHM